CSSSLSLRKATLTGLDPGVGRPQCIARSARSLPGSAEHANIEWQHPGGGTLRLAHVRSWLVFCPRDYDQGKSSQHQDPAKEHATRAPHSTLPRSAWRLSGDLLVRHPTGARSGGQLYHSRRPLKLATPIAVRSFPTETDAANLPFSGR